jgi:hypothetical protein
VIEAKQAETRARRIARTIEALRAAKPQKTTAKTAAPSAKARPR